MSQDDARPKVPGREPMRRPLPQRFYTAASVTEVDGQFAVLLDGRRARTPGKRLLAVPVRALAEPLAAEWAAQTMHIDPETMPLTRLVVTAIDAVAGREREVAAEIVKYAGSDLVCYRAASPAGLAARQAALWDPVLAWAGTGLAAHFTAVEGVVAVAQPTAATRAIAHAVEPYPALPLAALHVLTTLTGSALLALAHARGRLDLPAMWAAAHVDEDWQIARWGADADAADRRARRWRDADAASRVLAASADPSPTGG